MTEQTTGWQPIETAPRGKQIVGWTGSHHFIGEAFDTAREFGHRGGLIDRMRGKWVPCTHWAPLPEPPHG